LFFGHLGNAKIMAAKPQTFMNLSGNAVGSIVNFYKIPISNIIILHDEIDIDFGKIKGKIGGGNAGHNGLKSIDNAIGRQYCRIRIGVGRPNMQETPNLTVADYVLSNFHFSQFVLVEKIANFIADKMESAILQNLQIDSDDCNYLINQNFIKNFDHNFNQ